MALPVALISIVLIAALITGAFVSTVEESRTGAGVVSAEQALAAAENAAARQIGGWDATLADSLAIGELRLVSASSSPVASTWLARLDSSLYWVIAEGKGASEKGSSSAAVRRRVGVLVTQTSDSTGAVSVHRVPERAWAELYW